MAGKRTSFAALNVGTVPEPVEVIPEAKPEPAVAPVVPVAPAPQVPAPAPAAEQALLTGQIVAAPRVSPEAKPDGPAFTLADSTDAAEQLDHYQRIISGAHVAVSAAINAAREYWVLTAGQALREIRDNELYKAGGYSGFEAYVNDRWDMSRQRAYQLMDAVPVVKALAGLVTGELNERQVRVLAPVVRERGEKAAVEVWRLAEERYNTKGAGLEKATRWLGYASDQEDEPADAPRSTSGKRYGLGRLLQAVTLIDKETVRRASEENPEEARRLAGELRQVLALIEE